MRSSLILLMINNHFRLASLRYKVTLELTLTHCLNLSWYSDTKQVHSASDARAALPWNTPSPVLFQSVQSRGVSEAARLIRMAEHFLVPAAALPWAKGRARKPATASNSLSTGKQRLLAKRADLPADMSLRWRNTRLEICEWLKPVLLTSPPPPLFFRLLDIEQEMTKFASYYAGTGCAVLVLGYLQVSTLFPVLI